MLILLQAVLGFDNLLYISLESRNAPPKDQAMVRKVGIGLAVLLRIILLLLLLKLIQYFQNPLIELSSNFASGIFNLHSIIVLLGGVFILYTAMKEIYHIIAQENLGEEERTNKSTWSVITWIVIMNLIFSFDSILSAMALSDVIFG